jgi:two-component system sensor histidine kinase KdpD
MWQRCNLEYPLYQEILHILASVLLVGLTTAVFYPVRQAMGTAIIALLYLLPIGINAAFWGLLAGILSAILAFFTLNFYFIPPYYSLLIHRSQDLVILIVFLGVTIVISQLVGRMRQSLQAATAREREAIQLYDLMVELSGLEEEQGILSVLARKTKQALEASSVLALVTFRGGQNRPPHSIQAAYPLSHTQGGTGRADFIAPIQMGGEFIGEIRIWRSGKPFNAAELRLIRIFISQAVTALEHVRLSRANTAAKILEESDRLKSSLLSSVSHELRTPLATIKAAVSSLRSEAVEWDSEARADLLALVEEETDHLNLLVGNLLNMSRIESGALTLERSWNALADIVHSAVERTAVTARSHRIVTQVANDLPFVYVDYLLIEQVLINLINNSVKYAPENSTIEIKAEQQQEAILVEVLNEGPQIPMEYLDRVFDKFFRLEQPQRVSGAGLGLSICKGIVEAHGGEIGVENRERGIAFRFTLPLQPKPQTMEAVVLKEMQK